MPNPTPPPDVLSPNLDTVDYTGVDYFDDDLASNTTQVIANFKKGYKTTEFWSTVLTLGAVLADGVFDLGVDTEGIVTLIGVNLSYVLGRSWVKTNRLKAISRY